MNGLLDHGGLEYPAHDPRTMTFEADFGLGRMLSYERENVCMPGGRMPARLLSCGRAWIAG